MPVTLCPRCEAELPEGTSFCTRCGLRLGPTRTSTDRPPDAEARFVACPACGATNAASRRRCARCTEDLRAESSTITAVPGRPFDDAPAADDDDDAPEAVAATGSPALFSAVMVVAGLALIGVILTILSARGVTLLGEEDADSDSVVEVAVAVSSIRASSSLPPTDGVAYVPEHLLDGDPTTVWQEDADGDGSGEWLELELEGSPEVSRLLLWNGDQREGVFSSTTRAARVRIELGDRTFEADLLDVDGPQAVDLPETITASSVRLTVLSVIDGGDNLTLSEIEVRGPPLPQRDPDGDEPPS